MINDNDKIKNKLMVKNMAEFPQTRVIWAPINITGKILIIIKKTEHTLGQRRNKFRVLMVQVLICNTI